MSWPGGPRTIPLDALHREPGATPQIETTLARDELILRIRVPTTPLGRASTYHKIRDVNPTPSRLPPLPWRCGWRAMSCTSAHRSAALPPGRGAHAMPSNRWSGDP